MKALEELGPADLSHPNRHAVDLCRCTGCGGLHTLRFAHITHVVNKEGKLDQRRRPIVHDLLLTAEQADWIEEMGQRVGVIDSAEDAGAGEREAPHDDAGQRAEAGTG